MIILDGPAATTANLELVTAAALKVFMKHQGALDDTRLQQVVDGVNRAAWARLGQRWVKEQTDLWDVLLEGSADGRTIWLPHKPVVTLSFLEVGYMAGGAWTTELAFAPTDYVLELDTGRVELTPWAAGGLPVERHRLRAKWTAGYAIIPPDLVHAVLQWMAVEYNRASGQRLDRTAATNEVGSDSFTFDVVPLAASRILGLYARKDRLFC